MEDDLQQAIVMIKSGDKKGGGQLLAEIVRRDPRNGNAWLWLTSCVSTSEQKIYCLKKVLEIEPNNQVALATLPKLQQIERPSEKDLLQHHEQPIQDSQQSIGSFQTKQVAAHTQKEKSSSFQPKYLTAVAGMGAMIGTVFPWAATVSGNTKLEEYSGLTQAPGILISVIGLAIVFLSIFHRTKPGKENSLISSLFALAAFLMGCLWVLISWSQISCPEAFFDPDALCFEIGTGFGYGLSMFSLFLVFIFGLIRNPKE